ncbi:hypothetical protein [Nitrincola sp. MINF-07-Sa-05]|uniref:hypothetical protein n=1 Tax=Nitrincola salilacus TaxID=3400273 RepID=UPI0039184D44
MKEVINVRFFACAFLMAMVFFMIGLLTYGSVTGLVIENGVFVSVDGYWQFTLINGSVFGLAGFLMVLYAWLDGAPKVNIKEFVLLFIKMTLLSVVVYSVGIFLIWGAYSSYPVDNILSDGDILVSIDDLNIYWSAVLLLVFWVVLLARLLVVKKIRDK